MFLTSSANAIVSAMLLVQSQSAVADQPSVDEALPPVAVVQEVAELPAAAPQKLMFEELTDEQVFDKAARSIEAITTMTATFMQTDPRGEVTTGRLSLSRPNRLLFEYDAPSPLRIVASQGLVYVQDTDLETVDSYPVRKTPLKFLLSRKIKTDDAILAGVYRQADSVALRLSSDDEDTEGELVMIFDEDMVLTNWAVEGARGDLTLVDLSDIELGAKIAASTYKVPEADGVFLNRDR